MFLLSLLLISISPVQCDDQLIVTFTRYLSRLERKQVLRTCLSNSFDWYTIPKARHVEQFSSDFSVIYVGHDLGYVKPSLIEHDLVKGVFHDKIIQTTLKAEPSYNTSNNAPGQRSSSYLDYFRRKILSVSSRSVASLVHAPALWRRGYRGAGVRVAVLDTGLNKLHPHFSNIGDTIDFTDENEPNDKVIGHGTFVAGVIASSRDCLGIAPDTLLYSLKVFNSQQISHTSWFLDAFNYVVSSKIDIINLSIGGPDFQDSIFINKVMELTSKGIIFVSAMGNDGPLYGTLNNPADQLDVIGVGGLNYDDEIAEFSSRGMTLWELPEGSGRVKPDIVTYGTAIRGSNMKGSCRYLTGTSVSSPVVTGAVSLLTEIMKKNERLSRLLSPASIKQVLMASADRLPGISMYEQGSGKMNLPRAYELLQGYVPQITLSPGKIDWTDCPYMWPICSQPLYYTAMPITVNMTIINGMGVLGSITSPPTWHPNTQTSGNILQLSFRYSSTLWPWTGYLAITLAVAESGAGFAGTVEGYVLLTVTSPATSEDISDQTSTLHIPVKVNIIPTPPRKKRILWDHFHSIGYPVGPFPRDNLKLHTSPLDWNGDHIHTNFNGVYKHLRSKGYFVEILSSHFGCFDAQNYGYLFLVDSEDAFFESEIKKLNEDVTVKGLNLVVFADWYNGPLIKHIKFYDENTKQWVVLQGGGANVPALNKLLAAWGVVLSDKVWYGKFSIGPHAMDYASGTSLLSFPTEGKVFTTTLSDEATEMIHNKDVSVSDVPIFGLHHGDSGSVAVYGDSSCIDNAGHVTNCYWFVEEVLHMIERRSYSFSPGIDESLTTWLQTTFRSPKLASTPLFHQFSRVITQVDGIIVFRDQKMCPVYPAVESRDYNDTYPIGQLNNKLLSINLDNQPVDFVLMEETEDENSIKLFYILGFITFLMVLVVCAFLYFMFSFFHKKRIILYRVRTRRRV